MKGAARIAARGSLRVFGAAALCALLLSCAPGGVGTQSYRDTAAPIGATTRFEPQKFSGDWVVRQSFEGPAAITALRFTADDSGRSLWLETDRRCTSDGCTTSLRSYEAERLANGIFDVNGAASGETRQIWVLWVDEGHRTAALGTPDGRFGWIMDRRPEGGEDRIAAAREIMAFYGYDIALLKDVTWPE